MGDVQHPPPPFPQLRKLVKECGHIYGYSFILTSLDVSAPDKAAAAEHWYRHELLAEILARLRALPTLP